MYMMNLFWLYFSDISHQIDDIPKKIYIDLNNFIWIILSGFINSKVIYNFVT